MLVLHATLVEAIAQGAASPALSPPTTSVLKRLAALLALSHVEAHLGDFLEDGYLTGERWLLAGHRRDRNDTLSRTQQG
jgi:hypothetical protein